MKLFDITKTASVYAYSEPVNMTCSFNGLGELVRKKMRAKPDNGDLYVFINRRVTYIKVLYYYKNTRHVHAVQVLGGIFNIDRMHGQISVSLLTDIINNVVMPEMRTVIANKAIEAGVGA